VNVKNVNYIILIIILGLKSFLKNAKTNFPTTVVKFYAFFTRIYIYKSLHIVQAPKPSNK